MRSRPSLVWYVRLNLIELSSAYGRALGRGNRILMHYVRLIDISVSPGAQKTAFTRRRERLEQIVG